MDAKQSRQIEKLYLEMYDKLMELARKNEDSVALAEEAVQDAFGIACQKVEECCNSPNPEGWLVKTLIHVIQNNRKKRATAKRLIEQYLMAQYKEASITENRLDVNILYQNVAGMEEFKLLSEMAIEGKSHKEMAASRGITVSACKKRVQRAKEVLQIKLSNDVTK